MLRDIAECYRGSFIWFRNLIRQEAKGLKIQNSRENFVMFTVSTFQNYLLDILRLYQSVCFIDQDNLYYSQREDPMETEF